MIVEINMVSNAVISMASFVYDICKYCITMGIIVYIVIITMMSVVYNSCNHHGDSSPLITTEDHNLSGTNRNGEKFSKCQFYYLLATVVGS